MKKLLFLVPLTFFFLASKSQNPGLAISEILANPASTDSCKEYVELFATQNITFSQTPYTIIVNNNGTASSNGWIAGGNLTYAFEVSTGSVAAGDVVYVGGSCMSPTGTVLRSINVKYNAGDGGMGNANASGVFGNGGSNVDGVAVFSVALSSITSSTVPTDALFYGTGIGSASISSTSGYQLPVNDFYSGGKLQSSYFAPDPASDEIITASGVFNTVSNAWSIPRSIATGTVETNAVSSLSLSTALPAVPVTVLFVSNDTTVSEGVSNATIYVKLLTTSTATSAITVSASALSSASSLDYSIAVTTLTFAANTPANSTFPVTISLTNDVILESSEHIVLRFANPDNATIGSVNQFNFYIQDNDKQAPTPSNALSLNLLSSFSNSVTGINSAEIVVHDPTTQRLYIANSIGGKLDVVNFINPSNPVLLYSVPITTYGNINSVAVFNGTVAAAIENGTNPQDSGRVVFFNPDGVYMNQVKVGMMPDMITFNQAGTKVLTANEGEPNQAYTNDPDGSVSIVNISGGISALTQANVSHVTFTVYNGQETALRAQGVRIYGPSATAAKDFEPEYITVAKDDSKAWVTLQENNAIVEINLSTNAITSIRALGTKDHNLLNNGYDASNMTRSVNIANFPVKGFYLPDAIASYSVGGVNYLITANEGDARAYTGFSEETRINGANLDASKFPLSTQLKNNYFLGRLNITNKSGDTDNDGDLDTLYSYGSRSFSIWNANTGVQVYDSKDDLEMITASNSFSVLFNVSNNNNTKKDRSDDKGPEPEGVTIGAIGTNTYAFIAIERIGGVMVYDVTNPSSPVFVTYVNNRGTSSVGPDLGAEGIIFIPQSQSPNGQHIVISANEISSSLSIWGIPGCTTPIASSLSVAGATSNLCSNNGPVLSVATASNLTFQWSLNGTAIPGATLNSVSVSQSGNYSVAINGGTNCLTGSLTKSISVNPTPTLSITGPTAVCIGSAITKTLTGANTYSWSNNLTGSVVTFTPTGSANYTITATAANNCTATITGSIIVNALPVLTVQASKNAICVGDSMVLSATGALLYQWSNASGSSSTTVAPTTTTSYTVTGTNSNGCVGTSVQQVLVNVLPTVSITTSTTQVCSGDALTFTASGASSYTWSGGGNGTTLSFTPTTTGSYTLTGADSNGCLDMAVQAATVLPLPVLTFSSSSQVICVGQTAVLMASGANTYSWSTGSIVNSTTVSPTQTTSYTLTGYSAEGCMSKASISQSVVLCTELTELANNKVSIYPNPTSGVFYVSFDENETAEITMFDVTGHKVMEQRTITSREQLTMPEVKAGVYFIVMKTRGSTSIKKIILQ